MSMNFSFGDGRAAGSASGGGGRPDDGRPFRILVIADFSGRASRGCLEPLAGRAAMKVDIDRLDGLPGDFGSAVHLAGRGGVSLSIDELDDLHPDSIYDKCELFAALRDLRTRARDANGFRAVADEVRSWAGRPPTASQIETKPAAVSTPESEFAAMLSESVGRQPKRPALSIDSLLKQIVGPHIVPDRDPQQTELIEIIERAIAGEMRAFLRDPDWRRTESAWRSLQMLVTRLELDEDLQLFAMDASTPELAQDAGALEQALVTGPTQTAGGVPWSLILHLEQHTPDSLDALAPIAGLAHRAGAVLVSGVAPQTLGISEMARTPNPSDWDQPADAFASLAESPAADAVCLTCPGVLLRLPYGSKTDEIERFAFEELKGDPVNHDLLWGSGAIAVAIALGSAFTTVGWNVQPIGGGTLDDLPVIVTEGGDSMHPCAQAWLSDRAGASLASRGITPLLSVQHRGAVQIGGLRAMKGQPLAFRWG